MATNINQLYIPYAHNWLKFVDKTFNFHKSIAQNQLRNSLADNLRLGVIFVRGGEMLSIGILLNHFSKIYHHYFDCNSI